MSVVGRAYFDRGENQETAYCPGCGRQYTNGECLMCDGDGNPWDGHAALAAVEEHIVSHEVEAREYAYQQWEAATGEQS